MHEYFQLRNSIEPIFERHGFGMEAEELHPNVFGSAFCVFSRGKRKFRVIWDGKDGCGVVQVLSAPNSWSDLLTRVPESRESDFERIASVLAQSLETELADGT